MLIEVKPDIVCSLRLQPIKAEDRKLVRESNQYDGTCIVYLIDSQDVEQFISTLSVDKATEIDNGYTVQVDIDSWEFRHMVGGQSD